jgi:hypothetical protein
MIVHLVDGTYELFRHFYGLRRFTRVKDSASRGVNPPYGAVVGVLQTLLQLLENDATHLGVAESLRRPLPGNSHVRINPS